MSKARSTGDRNDGEREEATKQPAKAGFCNLLPRLPKAREGGLPKWLK